MLLCRSRTYDLPITSSDAPSLSYRRLVGAKTPRYSEKTRMLLCRSRPYDLPITSSDAQSLNYRRLVETKGAFFWENPKTDF